MTVDFCDHFWGERNNGFDVLYHNMKYGQIASKELVEFFRERLSIEETLSKLLSKLAKQASGNCVNGTFAPLWQVLKVSSERQSTLHLQMVQKFQELIKDVAKYSEAQHKNHKNVKEGESGTLEIVQSIQTTAVTLMKAKEIYHQRCVEYEKLKRDNASAKEVEKAEQKFQKACDEYKQLIDKYGTIRDEFERKMLSACRHFQELEEAHIKQMKLFLHTYSEVIQSGHDGVGLVHAEFCRQCSETSVDKLLEQFVQSKATGRERPGPKYFEDADVMCGLACVPSPAVVTNDCNSSQNGEKASKKEGNKPEQQSSAGRKSKASRRTSSLLNLFLPSHGQVRIEASLPDPHGDRWTDEGEITQSSQVNGGTNVTPSDGGGVFGRNTFRGSKSPVEALRNINWTTGLWKSKPGAKKEKKLKKNKRNEENSESEEPVAKETSVAVDSQPAVDIPEVDEEGYSVRPEFDTKQNDRGVFYSSSDSDSEEEKERKIHIEIKPLTNGSAPLSASIDELRASVGGLALSPVGPASSRRSPISEQDNQMKRSVSASQPISSNNNKPGSDLLSMGSVQSPSTSSASTPTGGYTFVPSPASTGVQSPATSSGGRSAETTPTPTKSEDLGDFFSELADLPPALPPKLQQGGGGGGGSRGGTPVGPPMLPRPPSRRALEGPSGRGRMSPIAANNNNNNNVVVMNRADSLGSLSSEFRACSMSVGSSRGPSPLTIGMSDIVPIAVAFQEIAHAYFKGTEESRCLVKLTGDMMMSFPAGIVQVLANNPSPAALVFRLRRGSRLEALLPNRQLVMPDEGQSTADSYVYEFNMAALTTVLRRQAEQNPTASYFNVDILKYQVRTDAGAQSAPLHLVAYWKCESQFTDLRLDYKYNAAALSVPSPLLNITMLVPVDGGVTSLQSKPTGQWIADSHRAMWRFTELSQHSDDEGTGCIRARFDLRNGPGSPGTIAVQFSCEGTTLSGADFDLVGLGYRVSLVKRRVIAGKYICETDVDMRYRYAPPPSV